MESLKAIHIRRLITCYHAGFLRSPIKAIPTRTNSYIGRNTQANHDRGSTFLAQIVERTTTKRFKPAVVPNPTVQGDIPRLN